MSSATSALARWLQLLTLLHVVGLSTTAWAQDRVTITTADGRGSPAQLTGTIVDYTGKQLEIDLGSGVRRKVAADLVTTVETKYTPDHTAGDALYAKQDYPAAIAKYLAAMSTEKRRWAQRRVLGQLVRSYRAQGAVTTAGTYFLTLVNDDPDALDFDAIPLAWQTGESEGVEKKAAEWLANETQPVAVLLGASHLLQSPQAATALQKLQQLTRHRDARLATLAEAQVLRATVATLAEGELRRWDEKLALMPSTLRAGAYYTLGRAWFQRNQHSTAALYLLRNPILYPQDHRLAAESLLLAAEALHKANQQAEAARVLRELLASYPQARASREGRQRAGEWGVKDEG